MPEVCPHCGERLPFVVDAFCPECRERLDDPPFPAREAPSAEAAKPPDRIIPSPWRAVWCAFLACVWLIAAVRVAIDRDWTAAALGAIGAIVLFCVAAWWWKVDDSSVTGRGKDWTKDKQKTQ